MNKDLPLELERLPEKAREKFKSLLELSDRLGSTNIEWYLTGSMASMVTCGIDKILMNGGIRIPEDIDIISTENNKEDVRSLVETNDWIIEEVSDKVWQISESPEHEDAFLDIMFWTKDEDGSLSIDLREETGRVLRHKQEYFQFINLCGHQIPVLRPELIYLQKLGSEKGKHQSDVSIMESLGLIDYDFVEHIKMQEDRPYFTKEERAAIRKRLDLE